MSQPLFDETVDFADRSGGLRAIVFDDDTARLQLTGHHSAKVQLRHSDLANIDNLLTQAGHAVPRRRREPDVHAVRRYTPEEEH